MNKKKLLSLALTLAFCLGLVPGAALAVDEPAPQPAPGAAQACHEGGEVTTSEDGKTITVTYGEGVSLNWSDVDNTAGRTSPAWWVGVNVFAPETVTADNVTSAKYRKVAEWWTDDDGTAEMGEWLSFDAKKDSETAPYYMGVWVPLQGYYFDRFEVDQFQARYEFDWDGNQTPDLSLTIVMTPDITFTDTCESDFLAYDDAGEPYGGFSTLASAIDALNNALFTGGKVKLNADATVATTSQLIGNDMTLDFNTHSITGSLFNKGEGVENDNRYLLRVAEDVTATFLNAKLDNTTGRAIEVGPGATLTLEGEDTDITGASTTIVNVGTLNVNAGALSCTSAVPGDPVILVGSSAYPDVETANATIKNATITNNGGSGVGVVESGTLTVGDGAVIHSKYNAINGNNLNPDQNVVIEGTAQITSDEGAAVYKPATGDLTVTGGTLSGAAGIVTRAGATIISSGSITATGTADLTVGDNSIAIPPAAVVLDDSATYNKGEAVTVTISAGEFTAAADKPAVALTNAAEGTKCSISLTGGTYSSEVTEFVASGYRLTESEGKWTVSKRPTPSYTPPTTTTTTTTNEDGSTTTTTTDKSTGTVTETTKQPDGSSTTVETKTDGTVTTTEKAADGSTATTVENPDGSSQVDVKQADGTTAAVTTDTEGKTQAQVEVSEAAVTAAQESGEAVALPIPAVQPTEDPDTAPVVKIGLPADTEATKVEIPAEDVTPGTVAVIVHADGTEEVIKTSLPTDGGLTIPVEGNVTVKLVDNTKPFDDLTDGHWAKDSVDFVSARELFVGTAENTFSPSVTMSRAMLLTVLARVDGVDPADDVIWYGGALDWAVENGISDGSRPEDEITREQFATILYRYFGAPQATGSLSAFPDAADVSSFAADAMRWAVENGIITGTGNGTLDPSGSATRAEAAAMLERFIKLV